MKQYEISPTEALRRGIAVCLYDQGVHGYNTDLNAQRSKFVKQFLDYMQTKEQEKIVEKTTQTAKELMELLPKLMKEEKKEHERL